MSEPISRRVWHAIEPVHSHIYFVPEAVEEYERLGLERISQYFASRSAAMGAVTAPVVAAAFYVFSPGLVARAMRDAWSTTTPERLVEARMTAVRRALGRCFEPIDDSVVADAVDTALPVARDAASGLEFAGRALSAAHAGVDVPDDPVLALWHHLTVLREHRGDGHVVALTAHEVSPIAALATADGFSKIPVHALQKMRGWRDEEWAAGVADAQERGWLDAEGKRTEAGDAMRRDVERLTDELADEPWRRLGSDATEAMIAAVEPLRSAIISAGAIPRV